MPDAQSCITKSQKERGWGELLITKSHAGHHLYHICTGGCNIPLTCQEEKGGIHLVMTHFPAMDACQMHRAASLSHIRKEEVVSC